MFLFSVQILNVFLKTLFFPLIFIYKAYFVITHIVYIYSKIENTNI